MVHKPEQGISITKALLALADANRLKYINHDIYETQEGEKLILTELGFVEESNYNYHLLYHSSEIDKKELQAELKAMKAERATLCGQNKELSGKTLLGARKILDSKGKSYEEIVKELKKYLVI